MILEGPAMRLLSIVLGCVILGACASTKPVMVGQARPPITPDQVKIYWTPPPSYEVIAQINASSKSVFTPGGQPQMDKVIQELKVEAAKLGANGLILQGFSDAQTASLGTGVGSQSYSGNTAVGVGVGGSFGLFKKTGHAQAIFVPQS
jgi:hypothetical protein